MGGTGQVSAFVVVQHALCMTARQAAIVKPDTDARLLIVVTIHRVSQ